MLNKLVPAVLLVALAACQSTRTVVEADSSSREPLFDAVSDLVGRWEGEGDDGMQLVHEIAVTSNGSVVREVMFPGGPHEMTNMYSLDGNSLVMTHYCAGGNQPRMRATSVNGNQLVFASEGVSDLKADDEIYMGAMTLVRVDKDTMEQHWKAFRQDEVDHEAVFRLKRVR